MAPFLPVVTQLMTLTAPRMPGAAGRRAGPRDFPHIGIFNDYLSVPYATGSTFASQFLQSQFKLRGHKVTVVGPRDPTAQPHELPQPSVPMPSVPVRSNPGFYLPMPSRWALQRLAEQRFDVVLGQTASSLMEAGGYLRAKQGVPLVCVNTSMLSSIYDVLLPESMSKDPKVQAWCKRYVVPFAEQASVKVYNNSDGLIVLSKGLERYWRDRGVTVPIHIIPRTVNPAVTEAEVGADPFPERAAKGARLIVLCRHVREKSLARIIDLFGQHIAPKMPEATLTLVGDGPDQDSFKKRVARLNIGDRVFFPGEVPVSEAPTWYAHGDVFLYASLSETYGQVVSEAMYWGLPVVAMDDDAGVAQQIQHGRDSLLLPPGPDIEACNERFAAEVIDLLARPARRRALGEAARRSAMTRTDPDRVIQRYYTAFEQARRHRSLSKPDTSTLGLVSPLVKWGLLHSTVSGLGWLRPPGVLNRNQVKQPGWVGKSQASDESSDSVDSRRTGTA